MPFQVIVSNLPLGLDPGSTFLFYDIDRLKPALDLGPLGLPGCTLFVQSPLVLPCITSPLGFATCDIPIPLRPGFEFFNQAVIFDPLANPLGVALSNPMVGTSRL